MNEHGRLLTLQEVLAACAKDGRPLTASTFRTYVTKGIAPPPARRQGRVPLWDSEQIHAWAAGELGSITAQHAAERYADANPRADASAPVQVRSEHLVRLDPALPEYEAVAKFAEDVKDRLARLQDAVAWTEAAMERQSATQDPSGAPEGQIVARILRQWNAARKDRAQRVRLDSLGEQLAALRTAEEAARADLERAESWMAEMLSWAEHERDRRHSAMLDEEARVDEAERTLDLTKCVTDREFVRQGHHRLASRWYEPEKLTEVLARIDAGEDPKANLILGGGDFGHGWRLDGTDLPGTTRSGPRGAWRVSWIGGSTGEVYAYNTEDHRVLLLGTTPATTSTHAMIAWFAPLEGQQSRRNSLAMLAEAFVEQRETGFPGLTGRTDLLP